MKKKKFFEPLDSSSSEEPRYSVTTILPESIVARIKKLAASEHATQEATLLSILERYFKALDLIKKERELEGKPLNEQIRVLFGEQEV